MDNNTRWSNGSELKSVLDSVTVPTEILNKINENRQFNKVIIKYYEKLLHETGLDILISKMRNMQLCNAFYEVDVYREQKIKDFKRTNNCKDKHCSNCKKVVQAARMAKYIPELEKYKAHLYHMTLTQVNCTGDKLEKKLKKMSRKFKMLIEYLSGREKIKGIDFTGWEYQGAIRSLEITFRRDSYHPHYHIAIVFEGELGHKYNVNKYSYSNRSNKIRYFSDAEILIQKIWYLLMNDKTVTKEAISSLKDGYSCVIDKFKSSDYVEIFKYISKVSDEENKTLTYNNFKILHFALHFMKQIQGYGCFYKIKNNLSEKDINEADQLYNDLIVYLQSKESPIYQVDRLEDLIKDSQYTLISRKRIYKYLVGALSE